MPDIDMDFDERRRGDMIRYATEKYGEERVAQIITYGTIKAKAAIKDAARVLGLPVRARRPDHQGDAAAGHGQGHPAARASSTRSTSATARPPSSAALYEAEPDVQQGRRHRARAWRGSSAQRGRARRRRDPVPRAADRRHPDVAARAGRRDHHPVGHGCVRGHRPAEDGLPRPAQPHRHRTTACDNIKANRGETIVLEDARRSTTGPPTSCSPAATPSACSSSTAGRCARCCARCSPTTSRTSPPSSRCTGPGPMGANAHNDYADRKNGRKPVVPIHPELAEPLADILGDTYGLIVYQEQVMAHRAEARRLLARRRRPAAPGDGQEEEGDPRQGVRAASARA